MSAFFSDWHDIMITTFKMISNQREREETIA